MESVDQMRKGTTTLAILKLLNDAEAPMHGYQIARELEQRSQGSFQFKEGLLYPRLHQMEHEGLLISKGITPAHGGKTTRIYRETVGHNPVPE